jgi:hypothetical protein
LNTKNKINAIGALAAPVLRHSFGIINWRSVCKMHHRKADIDGLYVKRERSR